MAIRQPRYSKEEFAKQGDAIYESQVRAQVEADNHSKIVAINIETGAFKVADDTIAATDSL
jgi:23S rRNA maturation mini-RNase III